MVAVAALGAAACSGDPAPEPPGAGSEIPTIVATTGIWADVVANVACDGLAEVETLIPVGGDPHGYEPSLQDRARMENATLVVANGLLLEEALEDTLDAVEESGTPVFRFADEMEAIPFAMENAEHGHDHEDEDGHDHDEDETHEDEDGHDHDEDETHEDEDGHDHDEDEAHEDEDGHDHDEDEATHEDEDGHDHDEDETHEDEDGHDHDEDEDGHDHDEDEDGHDHDEDEAHEDEDGHDHDEDEAHEDEDGHDHDEDETHEDEDGHDHDEDETHEDEDGHDHDEDETHEDEDGHDHDEDEAHEDEDGHDHDEDEAHEDEDGHDHDHTGGDPHVWFDPHRVAEVLPALAQVLTTTVGLDQAAVEACLNSYVAELEAVDAEIAAKVEQLPAGSRKLVTNHDALGYFADRYGFEVIGTVIPTPASMAQASPAQLEALAEIIEHEGINAIFAETLHSVDDIEALAARVGDVDVVTLYTGSLGPRGSGAETYTGFLRTNTDLIVDALG